MLKTPMLKTIVAGAVALGIAVSAAPQQAAAGDDVLKGVIAGAIIGGTIGAIAEAHDRDRRYYAPPPRYYSRRPVVVERYYAPPPRYVERRVIVRDYYGPRRYYGRRGGYVRYYD